MAKVSGPSFLRLTSFCGCVLADGLGCERVRTKSLPPLFSGVWKLDGHPVTNLGIRNEYFNSKAGRLREREAALAATDGGSVRG